MSDNSIKFETVLTAELQQIDRRRQRRKLVNKDQAAAPTGGQATAEARDRNLVGLAFSGGGIRSATFNLGILQGLARLDLLKRFDYLSTVSGGGYIGGWLAAWIHREGVGKVEDSLKAKSDQRGLTALPDQTRQNGADPAPIQYLRRHSNYLAPRLGFLSADPWVLWAIYLKNFLLNQLVLLPAVLIVLLLSRLTMFAYYPAVSPDDNSMFDIEGMRVAQHLGWTLCFSALSILFFGSALRNILAIMHATESANRGMPKERGGWILLWILAPPVLIWLNADAIEPYLNTASNSLRIGGALSWIFLIIISMLLSIPIKQACSAFWRAVLAGLSRFLRYGPVGDTYLSNDADRRTDGWLLFWVLLPLLGATISFCYLCPYPSPHGIWFVPAIWKWPTSAPWSGLADLSLFATLAGLFVAFIYWIAAPPRMWNWGIQWVSMAAGLGWGALLYVVYCLINSFYAWSLTDSLATLQISATAKMTTFGPPLILISAVVALSLAVGLLRGNLDEDSREKYASICARILMTAGWWAAVNLIALYGTVFVLWASPWVKTALGSGWLLTMVAGILAGRGESTGSNRSTNQLREFLARLALPIFVVGVFVLTSLMLHEVFDNPPDIDLSDESIAPAKFEPANPPSQVEIARSGENGLVGIKRKSNYQQIPDEALAASQRYWLGMLNSSSTADNRPITFWIDYKDLKLLKNKGIHDGYLERVKSLRFQYREWTEQEFRQKLDETLLTIGRNAKDSLVTLGETRGAIHNGQGTFNFKLEFTDLPELIGRLDEDNEKSELLRELLTGPLQFKEEDRWEWDEFGERLDQWLPDAKHDSKLAIRRNFLVPNPDSEDPGTYVFRFFQKPTGSNLSVREMIALSQLQWVRRRWSFGELEDQMDLLFPSVQDQEAKSQIFHEIIRTAKLIELSKLGFLCKTLGWLAGFMVLLVAMVRVIDVNSFSLQGLYCNRLTRAYLGASKAALVEEVNTSDHGVGNSKPLLRFRRLPDPLTGFDLGDDLELGTLGDAKTPYDGPYPIFNTAMNLVHTKELAWQERMAESFSLTPLYCGSQTTGYRPTKEGYQNGYGGNVKLGTAVAVSGAAVSPNWGYHSSAAITFVLTVFNARLGAWLGNPIHEEAWRDPTPRWGFGYLFKELFGWTDEAGPYVYLSDGGHFENLGVYELIRRRCRYIVVCDADEDGEYAFENLGNLIRKVRIDLGISIEIAPDCLRLLKDSKQTRWHCAMGKIRYEDVDALASPGTLVYIKPSLTGDEPADILQYATAHPSFPHETTANQFYTESQFESYRALGQHVATSIFELSNSEAVEYMNRDAGSELGRDHERWCRELFASLERRWFAMPPEYDAHFIASTHGFIAVHEAFQKDPRLWRLTLDLYPEMDVNGKAAERIQETNHEQRVERQTAELHALLEMLQVMENAYLSLNLEVNYSHPMNRGWMDVFHRWTSAKTFRLQWPLLRGEFGRDFIRFCEKQMSLGVVKGKPVELVSENGLQRLLLEFEDQWPEQRKWLEKRLKAAIAVGGPFAWSVHSDNPYPLSEKIHKDAPGMPVGIILLWPTEDTGVDSDVYELFVWMRGAYRNTGLGRSAVVSVLRDLSKRWPDRFRLKVRLPVGWLSGPGGKLQREMWLTFYNHLDFVRTRLVLTEPDVESIIELHRDFH